MLHHYVQLMRLDKPIGIFLLLWPALIAIWFASNGSINFKILIIFVLGVVVMRSAGCVINDFADRNFDARVKRTRYRPLATKKITPQAAICLFVFLLSIAFLLVINLNLYSILLSCVAGLLAIIYPFCKRFISIPQVVLGVAFAWSIPMAYAAITNHLIMDTWILFFASTCWIIAYDTQYAMVDQADDREIGIKSSAILFGKFAKLIIMVLQLIFVLSITYLSVVHRLYYCSITSQILAIIVVIQQQKMLQINNPEQCFQAFLDNNKLGLLLFIGICGDFYYLNSGW